MFCDNIDWTNFHTLNYRLKTYIKILITKHILVMIIYFL